jgi:hypothetical protein
MGLFSALGRHPAPFFFFRLAMFFMRGEYGNPLSKSENDFDKS